MFNLIGAVLSGLIIGWLARFFYPGVIPMGWIMTILLGIGGSLLASLFGTWAAGGHFRGGFSRAGCLSSVLGAMVLIFIGRHFG